MHAADLLSFEWSTQANKEPICKSAWNARAAVQEPKQNGEFYLQYSSQLNTVTILLASYRFRLWRAIISDAPITASTLQRGTTKRNSRAEKKE
jgi:hypothetical protein